MDVRYFSTPRLRDRLADFKPGQFTVLNEFRPLAINTTYSGLAFDFNSGLRLKIPHGNWHVKIFDYDSDVVCFEQDVSDILLISLEKFFVRWAFALWLDAEPVFTYLFNPESQLVHFNFLKSGMGDRISLFPYMEQFRKQWHCKVSCSVEPYLQEIIRLYFPEVNCSDPPTDSYATYFPAPTFLPFLAPEECRRVPMLSFGQQIFGLQFADKIIYRPTVPRQIAQPYVCIGVQASAAIKAWLYPHGWDVVIDYLRRLGYRVLCIDKYPIKSDHGFTVKIPEGAEDFTGDFPLSERVNLLAYADFFVGLSSGLSWLAWAANCPVILISGITAP